MLARKFWILIAYTTRFLLPVPKTEAVGFCIGVFLLKGSTFTCVLESYASSEIEVLNYLHLAGFPLPLSRLLFPAPKTAAVTFFRPFLIFLQ